jgi:hypothetical protein
MRNCKLHRGALSPLLAAALLAACGGSGSQADAYTGVVDTTTWDAKFLPITSAAASNVQALCGPTANRTLPCYSIQSGFVRGKPIKFYTVLNAGKSVLTKPTSTTGTPAPPVFPLAASPQPSVFNPGNCSKGKPYDPRLDAYPSDAQFPIFGALPLATTTFGLNIMPLYNFYQVDVSGLTCNDMKSADSVFAGDFGAKLSSKASSMQLLAMVDPLIPWSSPAGPTNVTQPQLKPAWFKGLLGYYVDGGPVPVDGSGNVIPMDGVIINPAGSSSFANVFDDSAVILPAQPGEDAYSPVVRLLQYRADSGKKAGDYVGICARGATGCPANYVKIEDTDQPTNPVSHDTIFIVAQPQ